MADKTQPDTKPKRPRTNLLSVRLNEADTSAVRKIADRTGQNLATVLDRIAKELTNQSFISTTCRTIASEYIAQVKLELGGGEEDDDILPEPRMAQAQGIGLVGSIAQTPLDDETFADETFAPEDNDELEEAV